LIVLSFADKEGFKLFVFFLGFPGFLCWKHGKKESVQKKEEKQSIKKPKSKAFEKLGNFKRKQKALLFENFRLTKTHFKIKKKYS
jgi:hypothetical protein